jgi:hypothetical protein
LLDNISFSPAELNIIHTLIHVASQIIRDSGSTQTDKEMVSNLFGLHNFANKREQQEFLAKLGLTDN